MPTAISMRETLIKYLQRTSEAAPLAAFRVLFGLMMFISLVRFWAYGWIEKFYITPDFHFSYYGFEWVKPIGAATYLIFILCMISSLLVSVGWKYKWSISLFFLSFTYIELMDKTTYLNHYYFISILSFLMIWLPAATHYSVDAYLDDSKRFRYIPQWSIDAVKLMLGIVYFYAGLAKLNPDWLFEAMPLKIWLPSTYGIPLIGDLMQKEWIHYAFSWGGAIYDLTIPFLLLYSRTRMLAFVAVLFFHIMTRLLFPIGMFPYIMIISTLIFFNAGLHNRLLGWLSRLFRFDDGVFHNIKVLNNSNINHLKPKAFLLIAFFAIQLLFPFRYLLYPGKLFWTEEGYRFSWRVMLMEKAGYANFKIVDGYTGKRFYVDNKDFLISFQEKQMSTQADFILEYAHYLAQHFESQGHQNVEVYVESYVALNGQPSQPFIDPTIDLTKVKINLKHKNWILPYCE